MVVLTVAAAAIAVIVTEAVVAVVVVVVVVLVEEVVSSDLMHDINGTRIVVFLMKRLSADGFSLFTVWVTV